MTENTQLLNIAVLPPEHVSREIQRLSSEASRMGGAFKIDGVARHAHLTLYMARFPMSMSRTGRGKLREVLERLHSFRAIHTGYHVTQGNYYEISYHRSKDFLSAQKFIGNSVAPFRYRPGRPLVEPFFEPYSSRQKKNAEMWGYDLFGDLFRPHITLTRFAPGHQIARPESAADLSFLVERVALLRADEDGAATNVIDHVRINQSPAGNLSR